MDEMNVQNAQELDTTPTDAETQQEVDTGADLDTAPQGEGSDGNTSAQGEDGNANNGTGDNPAEVAPFLEIQYNHEKRNLSRDEAITLAQKGIHYQSTYDALERVATLKGQTVKEFLSGMETAQDEAYRQSLIEKFGDDEDTINKMMELYDINKQKTLDNARESRKAAAAQEEQTVNERLANEFVEMKNGDFPELTEFKDLPDEVKRVAFEGLSLSHAYLKYMHNENKKIAAAKASADAAAKKSTGSMASDKEDSNPQTSALLKGLWN